MFISLFACNNKGTEILYPYNNGEKNFNKELFYRNDLTLAAADPGCIYITEGEEKGYFYLYPTTDQMQTNGIMTWRSKDLNSWEEVGVVYESVDESWGYKNIWAPEVIYNPKDKKYYMYFSMTDESWKNGALAPKLCVAVSDSPKGPFLQWTGINAYGENIDIKTPFADFSKHIPNSGYWTAIDAHPFFDSKGDFYLYFVVTRENEAGVVISGRGSMVYGVKMKDMVTPDYSTVTQLTEVGKVTPNSDEICEYEGNTTINEAPFVLEHKGKYYLTYSMNGYTDPYYSVCQAVGDSPLGPFTKIDGDIANPILCKEEHFNYVSGTGHPSFVNVDGEMFIIYHQHLGRGIPGQTARGIAFDSCGFVYNKKLGYDVLYVNGPSYSVTPLPSCYSNYKNVADRAKISAENFIGEDISVLNDGQIAYHKFDSNSQALFKSDAEIILEFSKPQKVASVLVYNGINITNAFDNVDFIEIYPTSKNSYLEEKTNVKVSKIKLALQDVKVDKAAFIADQNIKPGVAALAEFEPVETDKIVIKILSNRYKKSNEPIGISEIVILAEK